MTRDQTILLPVPDLVERAGCGGARSRANHARDSHDDAALRPSTLHVGTGRARPLRAMGPISSASISFSTAEATREEMRICPPLASPQSRAARLVTVPMAP